MSPGAPGEGGTRTDPCADACPAPHHQGCCCCCWWHHPWWCGLGWLQGPYHCVWLLLLHLELLLVRFCVPWVHHVSYGCVFLPCCRQLRDSLLAGVLPCQGLHCR
jgi:hypothetical protein